LKRADIAFVFLFWQLVIAAAMEQHIHRIMDIIAILEKGAIPDLPGWGSKAL
jgi:hypothetical protein